jgi:hypothetical protein
VKSLLKFLLGEGLEFDVEVDPLPGSGGQEGLAISTGSVPLFF